MHKLCKIIVFLVLGFLTLHDIFMEPSEKLKRDNLPSKLKFMKCLQLSSDAPSSVVFSTDPQYTQAKLQGNRQLDRFPTAIAYCSDQNQVVEVMKCARSANFVVAPRAGGHDYELNSLGTSDGSIVIDVSKMKSINVNKSQKTATFGPGVRLGNLYHELNRVDPTLVFPGGSCPSVGVSGYILGGGHGLLVRKFGLGADALISLTLVDTKGNIIEANENSNSDLFWASKGGGGGNFGIVTSFTTRLYSVPHNVTSLVYSWSFSHFKEVCNAWQNWIPNAPEEFSGSMYINSKWSVQLSILYVGESNNVNTTFSKFLSLAPEPDLGGSQHIETFIDSVIRFGNVMDRSIEMLQRIETVLKPMAFKAKSLFIKDLIPSSGLDIIMNQMPTIDTEGYLLIDAYGGKVIPSRSGVFSQRDALFIIQFQVTTNSDTIKLTNKHYDWIAKIWKDLKFIGTGLCYINYVDSDIVDPSVYYGNNFESALSIKRKYDPEGIMQGLLRIPHNIEASEGTDALTGDIIVAIYIAIQIAMIVL
jgi:hypothetical protein